MPAIVRTIAHAAYLAIFLDQRFHACAHDQAEGRIPLCLARDECEETGLGHHRTVGELGLQLVQIEPQP